MFHHKSIKRFDIEGTLYDEADVSRLKNEYVSLVVLQMKDNGYVPRSDIDPDWTMMFLGDRDGFSFKLSVYGVYVGRRKSQQIDALYGYRVQYTKKPKEKNKTRAN
jgi:hypothetical protein